MKIIGVTGSIASGKSSVAKFFKDKGFYLFDADAIYHELLENNKKMKDELISYFGQKIIVENKISTKKILSKLNEKNIITLNSITHKYVINELDKIIKKEKKVVIEGPIPVREGFLDRCDVIICTTCSVKTQKKRLEDRKKYSPSQLLKMLSIQLSSKKYHQLADEVIETDNLSVKELGKLIDLLY
ncbi:MAG: dephospho-CoA kinase [Clostridiales bacterium]|nr:dephospho-CoA kinase [Clostridiales bacterium]